MEQEAMEQLYDETEIRLGRKLKNCEVSFLDWIRERYKSEVKESNVIVGV